MREPEPEAGSGPAPVAGEQVGAWLTALRQTPFLQIRELECTGEREHAAGDERRPLVKRRHLMDRMMHGDVAEERERAETGPDGEVTAEQGGPCGPGPVPRR